MSETEATNRPEIKIDLLSSGDLLCDGERVSLEELDERLQAARAKNPVVLYSRENAGDEPPPVAAEVMQLIARNRLRIRLASPADVADLLDLNSRESAKAAEETPASNVVEIPILENLFRQVRMQSASSGGVSVVRPDRSHFALPGLPPGSLSAQMVAAVKATVPSDRPRNIAVIAPPGSLAGPAGVEPSVPQIGRRIPFFGLLMGLAYTAHAVWVFEAAQGIAAGCRMADLLIVDSDALAGLSRNWQAEAAVAMRNANILVWDRSRERLGALRTAGPAGVIGFAD